jgi:hypothetical protein
MKVFQIFLVLTQETTMSSPLQLGTQMCSLFFRRLFRPSTLVLDEVFSKCSNFKTTVIDLLIQVLLQVIQHNVGLLLQSYSISAVTNAAGYAWSTTATGWTITPS